MKNLIVLALLFLGISAFATVKGMPHMDLEMSSYEYRALLAKEAKLEAQLEADNANSGRSPLMSARRKAVDPETAAIESYIKIGERNLQWVDLINSTRTPETHISLTSEATTHGYPISSPRALNFDSITDEWAVLQALMPQALKDVIFGTLALPATLPVSEREFIEWLRQVDDAYQMSARYKLLKPWKKELAKEATLDVRGYLLIAQDPDTDKKLLKWRSLSPVQRTNYSKAIYQMCINAKLKAATCTRNLKEASLSGVKMLALKTRYFPAAKKNYDSFFVIPKFRDDAKWTAANPNLMEIPFADPGDAKVASFLKFNIEDEFQWDGWKLQLNFIPSTNNKTTHVEFEQGATPHVNDLGGSIITMDGNAPLSEYDVQWTIRHEYGHVLGLPDCYIEFYEEASNAFVSYQLDITNLMCSRRGHFQQGHFDELKRVYFK